MSYVLTDRSRWLHGAYSLRGLGAGASASTSAWVKVATDAHSGASATTTTKNVAAAADVDLPDCSSAAVTGNDYIDSTFVGCCNDIKKMSGMSTADKAKGIGQCVARGAATGACMAAGVLTFGITTALAPICGTIGAAVFNRVMGWDATRWVGAGIGTAVCVGNPVCTFAVAELVGWISDALAPVFEGIFNPSAAKKRELAARAAFHALTSAREKFLLEADAAVRELWSNAVKSTKDVYRESLALLPAAYQAKAKKVLGFEPNYDGIAKALVAAGARITPLTLHVDEKGSTVADRLHAQRDSTGVGCERTAEGCLQDGYSEICPFSFSDLYIALFYAQGKLTGNTRDRQVAFEQQTLTQMQQIASSLLPQYQQAIAVVSTKVATVMVGLKQQALLEATQQASRATMAARGVTAASRAEAAADAAGKGFAKERASAVLRAQDQYNIAKTAYAAVLSTYGSDASAQQAACAKDAACVKALSGLKRAQTASELAVKNSSSTGLMHVAVGVGAVATAAYLLLRK